MPTVQFGTLWPSMTLLTVIGLAYSIIAPLINGFLWIGMGFTLFAFKYLFVCSSPRSSSRRLIDSRGLGSASER